MRAGVARILLSAPAVDALQARGQECPRYTIHGDRLSLALPLITFLILRLQSWGWFGINSEIEDMTECL